MLFKLKAVSAEYWLVIHVVVITLVIITRFKYFGAA
jgi:hypothetical protein